MLLHPSDCLWELLWLAWQANTVSVLWATRFYHLLMSLQLIQVISLWALGEFSSWWNGSLLSRLSIPAFCISGCVHVHPRVCRCMRCSLASAHTQNSECNGLTSESEQSEDLVPLLPSATQSPQTALHFLIISQVRTDKSADFEPGWPKKSPITERVTFSVRTSSNELCL